MANEIKAPTVERNGGFVFDRVVLEYFNAAGDRFVWDDLAGEWDAFSAYSTDHDIALTTETIDGQDWYAADMPAGVGAHTIIPKFFEVGAALTNGNHSYEGIGIPWDGDEIVDLAGLQGSIDGLQASISALGGGTITTSAGPVSGDDLSIYLATGITYSTATSNALTWTIADYGGPSLTGATCTLKLYEVDDYPSGSPVLSKAGTVALVDDDAVFTVELTAAETVALVPNDDLFFSHKYTLTLNVSGGAMYNPLHPSPAKACSVGGGA